MGVVVLPDVESYFRDDLADCRIIRDNMKLHRFKEIERFFHMCDNSQKKAEGTEGHDPLFKVRRLLDLINEKSPSFFKPGQKLSIDEAMFAFKGRSYMKQYSPDKPTKWGFKLWTLADSLLGYVLHYDVYAGKKDSVNGDCLLGEQVVLNLCKPYFNMFYWIFFDNFYTSVLLMETLLNNGLYACGTVRLNRKGLPKELKGPAKTVTLKLAPQEVKTFQKNRVTLTIWQDKRTVSILSTNINTGQVVIKERVERGNRRTTLERPEVVHVYNEGMGGVDLSDQHRSYYRVGHRSVKWWKSIAFNLISAIIANSWILYKLANKSKLKSKQLSQLEFRKALVKALLKKKELEVRPDAASNVDFTNPMEHYKTVVTLPHPRVCVQCKRMNRRTLQGKPRKSSSFCEACSVCLCRTQCFFEYHSTRRN